MPVAEHSRLLSPRKRRSPLVFFLALLLAGCNTADSPPVSAPVSSPDNLSYRGLEGFPDPVTLTDGRYRGEAGAEGGPLTVVLSTQFAESGDLDNDGMDETAVVLVTDAGDSRIVQHLALLKPRDGALEHVATATLGESVRLRSLEMRDEVIDATLLILDEGDPACCPTRLVRREYTLAGTRLQLLRELRSGPLERIAGQLFPEGEVLRFRSCTGPIDGSGDALLVDAIKRQSVADVVAQVSGDAGQPVFIDVEGRWLNEPGTAAGIGFDNTLEVTSLVRVEREGAGCDRLLADTVFLAAGSEPDWKLEIRRDGAHFVSPSTQETSEYTGGTRLSRRIFEFGAPPNKLTARFSEVPCYDSAGNFHSHEAEITFESTRSPGCAAPGLARGLD